MQNPADALTDQFLGWIADGGRSYGEVMDAWRSSCPRLTIWEDALSDGLVRMENGEGRSREQARVTLTAHGRARLRRRSEAVPATANPPQVVAAKQVPTDARSVRAVDTGLAATRPSG